MLKLTDNLQSAPAPEALVQGVNLRGVLGTGLEAQAKGLNPVLDAAVRTAQASRRVVPGLVFPVPSMTTRPRLILLVVTKLDHQGRPTLLDLEAALGGLRTFLGESQLRTVAVGPLGSGLPRDEVLALMLEQLGDLAAEVHVAAAVGMP